MKKLVLAFLFGCICLGIGCQLFKKRPQQENMFTEEFLKLDREQQIKKCGECHKQEYENELKGPHYNAFANLEAHKEYVNSDNYHSPGYKNFLGNSYVFCVRCHTGEPLYLTVFKGLDTVTDLASINKETHPNFDGFPTARVGKSAKTSVDCMTCHFNGKGVVTNADFKPSQNASAKCSCNPQPSAFFSSNTNCVSCHVETKSMAYTVHQQKMESNCNKCHNEYDAKGKTTHFTYWRHDPPAKERKIVLGGIFDAIHFVVDEKSKDLAVKWTNNCMPHRMDECGELIALIEVLDKADKVVAKKEIRLNRKTFHDGNTLTKAFGKEKVGGITGQELPLDGTDLEERIAMNKIKGTKIRITGSQKSQYWFSDSLSKKVYEKTVELN